jgi:hypothetical protein
MNARVYLEISSAGFRRNRGPIEGIPECITDSVKCAFDIDRTKAINIASESSSLRYAINLETRFYWTTLCDCYVWQVIWTTWEYGVYAEQEYMIIGANTGEVYTRDKRLLNL